MSRTTISQCAARLSLERLNLLGNCDSYGGNLVMRQEKHLTAPYRRGVEKRMSTVLEINLALWGMLICSGMEVAAWLHAVL